MSLTVSKAGLESMHRQLEDLKADLSKLQQFKGREAINSGNAWHDNNDFEQCEIEERRLITRIHELSEQIASATVIDGEITNANVVNYGDLVTLQISIGDEKDPEEKLLISDSDEPSEFGKISLNSPICKAIYHQPEGATVDYVAAGNHLQVHILKIERT